MNLKEFDFPKVTKVDLAFPTFDTIPELLDEAKRRGFLYNSNNEYCELFSKLFFSGGKVKFKNDLDDSFVSRAWPYCRALMGSFSPKHEHKVAICAMLLSELVEPQLDKTL